MMSRLSVAQRIYAGFGAMLAISALLAAVAAYGIHSVSRSFADYRAASERTVALSALIDDLSSARLADFDYRLHSTPEAAQTVAERLATLQADTSVALETLADDTETGSQIAAFSAAAQRYGEAFDTLTAQQADLATMLDQLHAQGATLKEGTDALMGTISYKALRVLTTGAQAIALMQLDVEQGLRTGDEAYLASAEAYADDGRQALAALTDSTISDARRETASSMIDAIAPYSALAQSALAAMAERDAFIADELDALGATTRESFVALLDTLRDRRAALSAQGAQLADTTLMAILAGAGVTLILGALLALAIGRGLSRTIRTIASRMRALADGDLDIELDDSQRHEVGQMVEALTVFRDNGRAMRNMDAEKRDAAQTQAAEHGMRARLQRDIQTAISAAVAGDFSARVPAGYSEPELAGLATSVNTLIETVDTGLVETGRVLSAMADADLSVRMSGTYEGAFARLKTDTNAMADRFAEIVGQLKDTSRTLKVATGEILTGANDLSSRTTRQAGTIQETSVSMDQLADTVSDTAEKARGALAKTRAAASLADTGEGVMTQANAAMERITTSSSKVSDIIKLIDDIAFQTNLLALNASVEAARAGEAGKGFAVVAIEVRRLAQSAAEASSEVKALIEQSATEVDGGSRLVAQAAETLRDIRAAVMENADLMDGISLAAKDQASAIADVTMAVRQLDEMTQHNAALVEETTASIGQTESQAQALDEIVARFQLGVSGDGVIRTRNENRHALRIPA